MKRIVLSLIALILAVASPASAGTLSLPRVSTGDTITASVLNDPRASIEAVINGGIENVNISATAAIDEDKILHKSGGHDHGGGAEGTPVVGVALEGYVTKLGISNDPGDTAHDINIATGRATDSTDSTNVAISATLTVAIDAQGANGMDDADDVAGDAEADTWYDVLVIQTSDATTQAGYYNKNGTSMNCPSGYTGCTFRVIGAVLTDGSKNIIQFQQHGDSTDRWYRFTGGGIQELSGGSSASYASIDISSSVSPNADEVQGYTQAGTANSNTSFALSHDGSNDQLVITAHDPSGSVGGGAYFSLTMTTAQTIHYKKVDGDAGNIFVTGFKESI